MISVSNYIGMQNIRGLINRIFGKFEEKPTKLVESPKPRIEDCGSISLQYAEVVRRATGISVNVIAATNVLVEALVNNIESVDITGGASTDIGATKVYDFNVMFRIEIVEDTDMCRAAMMTYGSDNIKDVVLMVYTPKALIVAIKDAIKTDEVKLDAHVSAISTMLTGTIMDSISHYILMSDQNSHRE